MFQLLNTSGLPLSEIAALAGAKLQGDPQSRIFGICAIEEPVEGYLAFTQLSDLTKLDKSKLVKKVGAIMVRDDAKNLEALEDLNVLLAKDPLAAVITVARALYEERHSQNGVHKLAFVDPSAVLGQNVSIGPFCVVGADSFIGDNSVLHPHVVVYPRARLGKQVVLHSGAVIREGIELGDNAVVQNGAVLGSDGFGYLPSKTGLTPIPHIGTLKIGENVDIGANACIDRSTFGTSQIGRGTKIDNLVQIGHNARIGEHVILCGCTGIAGSCNIASGVVIGGHVGIADHMTIAPGVRVAGKSTVASDLLEAGDYGGYPAQPVTEWRRQRVALKKLPRFLKLLSKLAKDEQLK